ncbi:MAG: Non-catalytic module family EXPN [Benniella sp.]|nr:MAG: Non-catalytic module family EXPN [Benniella sp.]
MVKFTSAAILLALVAISSAAPISSPPTTAASSSSTVSTKSNTDVFSSGTKYTGKATWFTDSHGACNEKWDGQSEPIAALNAHQMGAASWGNPVCNKRVRILNKQNGNTVVARIVDKCPGDECAWGSLDLSPAAFRRLGDLNVGVLDIEWHYV